MEELRWDMLGRELATIKILIWVVAWLVTTGIATLIGASRRRTGAGFLLGLFFGLIGAVFAFTLALGPVDEAPAPSDPDRPRDA